MRLKDMNQEQLKQLNAELERTEQKLFRLDSRIDHLISTMNEAFGSVKTNEDMEKLANSNLYLGIKNDAIDLNNVERLKLDNMITNAINFFHEIFELEEMCSESHYYETNKDMLELMMKVKNHLRIALITFDAFESEYKKLKEFQ